MLNTKALAASASAPKVYVEDVFSTYLYTGNGSTQTITNGIDLSGKGGLVWLKDRTAANAAGFYDTARGVANRIVPSSTIAQSATTGSGVDQFNSNGFQLASGLYNTSGVSEVSWTFRKAPKFFDIVTYTGTGSPRTIAHNLGSVPGCIIIKRTDAQTSGSKWWVYHRSLPSALFTLNLNQNDSQQVEPGAFNSTAPTASVFSIGSGGTLTDVNTNGGTYVAYLFAHEAGGFGDDGNQNVISCGSYTGNGSTTGPVVNLGWEPQWLLVKRGDGGSGDWVLVDAIRGIVTDGVDPRLFANLSDAENTGDNQFKLLATGFQPESSSGLVNGSGSTYIYIAIRRGPMKTPTDATKVFEVFQDQTSLANKVNGNVNSVDLTLQTQVPSPLNTFHFTVFDRLRNNQYLTSSSTDAENGGSVFFDQSFGVRNGTWFSSGGIGYNFRRAPNFFDVVAYTGNNTSQAVSHNLGKAPDLIIVKSRDQAFNRQWAVYSSVFSNTDALYLNLTDAKDVGVNYWNTATPSASSFTVGSSSITNGGSEKYIAYLFATCPGVSKVGSYTGSGTTKQIDCGFTNGAKFVLIKRTDSTGDWYVWDTARGIVSGNDPYILLNSATAEVTNTDYIDPLSSGFEISSTAPAAINANGGSYIFLAIA